MKKLIKKIVKKYLQKYVGREMAAFDNRIYDLEVKAGKAELKTALASINVEDAENVSDGSKKGVTEQIQLEIGKWYKRPHNQALFCIVGNPEFEPFEVYGFDKDGKWMIKTPLLKHPIQTFRNSEVLATTEEVEVALIAEAKRSGFKTGIKYINARFSDCEEYAHSDNFKYYPEEKALCLDGNTIFFDGKWAKIISHPEENIQEVDFEIDWSVPGQLVSYDGNHAVIVTSGEVLSPDLSGIKVFSGLNVLTKEFRNDWIQDNYSPFTGELIVRN